MFYTFKRGRFSSAEVLTGLDFARRDVIDDIGDVANGRYKVPTILVKDRYFNCKVKNVFFSFSIDL